MAFLELEDISKYFGRSAAVEAIDLTVDQGEFLTLLGPSGCGKTTILRMIAGFETPSTGRILLDGEDITGRGANKRPMGMVFQSYALFPHLTAEQNIAFGMQIQKQSRAVIIERCAELLELVGLGDKGRNYPHQLSGGQQQRVALARALAVEPKVLLLDEQQLKMTAIYVTHDQEEALAISDRIAVMAKGCIEQLDYPEEIYSHPRTVFAATFVGNSNQFRGTLTSSAEGIFSSAGHTLHVPTVGDLHDGDHVLVLVRPEGVTLHDAEVNDSEQSTSPLDNQIAGVIELRTFLGPFTRFHVRVDEHTTLTADIPSQQARDFAGAQNILVSFPTSACQVLLLEKAGAEQKEQELSLTSVEEI